MQGVLLEEVMRRCELYAASLSEGTTGPNYTYWSGGVQTTVDYIFMDVGAASLASPCTVREMEDLNTSDHLPISVCLSYPAPILSVPGEFQWPRIDWRRAGSSGALENFQAELQAKLSPFLEGVCEDRGQLDDQIKQVAGLLVDTARETLPEVQSRRRVRMKDDILSRLCCQSRAAWRAWKEAGSPREGPLFEQKNQLRREVRTRVNYCSAMVERRRVQRREMFRSQDSSRFRVPGKQRSRCSKLRVDGRLLSDPEELLTAWSSHFRMLSESKKDVPELSELGKRVEEMAAESFANEEAILDAPFTREEVARALKKLKARKAAGPDGIVGEHLKWGGAVVQEWLLRVLNAVVDLEVIPSVLKSGIIVPVYKGGGKDPTSVHSYRGVTLTSIVGKVLSWIGCMMCSWRLVYRTLISQHTGRVFPVRMLYLPLRR